MIALASHAFVIATTRDTFAAAKSLPAAKWDPATRTFRVPLSCSALVDDFAGCYGVAITDDARRMIEIRDGYRLTDEERSRLELALLTPLPDDKTLYEHQASGATRLFTRRRSILADDMGLGKTLSACIAAKATGLPVHVVCPATVRDNWVIEAAMIGLKISTYSWAKQPAKIDGDYGRYVLIADEAHMAQSGAKSQRGAAFLNLAHKAEYLFLLTGTPMKNGQPRNLFPLLQACNSPLALNRGWYDKRYCDAKKTKWSQWDCSGASNLDELARRVKPIMLRRMKSECLDLPPKTRVLRQADHTVKAKEIFESSFARLMAEYEARQRERIAKGEIDFGSHAADTLVKFGYRRQAASLAKVQAALDIAEEVLEQGGSIVLFTGFVETAKQLAVALRSSGVALLTGETKDRQALVEGFQSGKTRVFVTTFGAGGVGITLTAASTVVLVDRPWTPGDVLQAEDRLSRIGQIMAVLAVWLQWDKIDVAVDQLLEGKNERIEIVMGGKKCVLVPGMTRQQMAMELEG